MKSLAQPTLGKLKESGMSSLDCPSTSSGTKYAEEDEGPPWEELPDLVISRIAYFLYPWERIRMAKVCHKWYNGVMLAPSLWRFTEIRVRGNWRDNAEIEYVRQLGRYLKRLSISGTIRCHRHAKRFQRTVTTIFAILYRQGPVQLDELSINEFHFNHYFRGTSGSFARRGVVRSLKRFMRQQRRMREVDLSFNSMTEEEGVILLSSIATTRSADKLESLNIEELFKGKERLFECRAFIDAVTQFSNLTVLVMNYNCLSDDLLCAMADSVQSIGSLKQLDIRFTRSDIDDHVIHPTSWISFKHAFPSLRVYFRVHSWIKLNDLQKALVSEIPLTTLVLLGHNDDSFQPDRTLKHVARHYRSVLEKLIIEINPSYRTYHRSLVTIFKDCTKLNTLELRGRVEWPTLREIFEHLDEEYFKKGRRPSINYFRMTVVAQTHDSYAQEALVFEEYREALQRYDLDYQLIVEPQFFPLPLEYNHDQPFVYEAGNEPIDVDLL